MKDFKHKTALITGGGTGIGRASAELIAQRGGRVLVCGRREAPLRDLAEAYPNSISYLAMDVAQADDRTKALSWVRESFGHLDILVNNAAASVTCSFADHNEDQIRHQLEVNLISPMLLIHEALPLLGEGSCVLNVSSAGARYQGMPPLGIAPYSTAKAGLNQLTRVLATELGPRGIRVNAVAPGMTNTEMASEAMGNKAYVAGLEAITPLGRIGESIDVARVIVYLLSDDAGWVTGQVVDASGGFWLAA